MYLSRDPAPLSRAFGVQTGYMPAAASGLPDAYVSSVQWSRRFIGAKLFVALATLGLGGYREIIGRQFDLANQLRQMLERDGWVIANQTRLPLVCFSQPGLPDNQVSAIEARAIAEGSVWLSTVMLAGRRVFRACITSYETNPEDLETLVGALANARQFVGT